MISRLPRVARVLLARRAMRIALLVLSACTATAPAPSPSPVSVRDCLTADSPARFVVVSDGSRGIVSARRWTPDGWIAGDMPLVIDSGELSAAVAARGALALSQIAIGIAPIAIPDEVFGQPAELTDVALTLARPATGAITWTSDDEATARVPLALELAWSIHIDGGNTPLGTQTLPTVDVEVALTGDGDSVHAVLGLAAAGELWSWAGLLELTRLSLVLDALSTAS